MKRLDRYLLGEMVLPFVGGVMLIVVMLIGNTLFPLIQTIVQYSIPLSVVAKLVLFNVPTVLTLTLPAGMALSAAWAVNRFARDSEVTVIRMAGVSLRRFFRPIIVVGALTTLFSFWVGDQIAPQAFHQQKETENSMLAYTLQASPTLAADKVFTFQQYSFHIHQIQKDPKGDPNKLLLAGVTIYENATDPNGFPILTTAKTAAYSHDVWTLHDFVRHILSQDGQEQYEIGGRELVLNLHVPLTSLAESGTLAPEELSIAQLRSEMNALGTTGESGTDTFRAIAFGYYAKFALPFVCLAFALCAPPLALRFAKTGAYIGIFLSIVMVWVAWNTLLLTKFLGLSGKLSPALAAWSPDLLFGLVGLYLLWRIE
jgi:lipopolysaccharide export system permease protein